MDGQQKIYRIVGPDEFDIERGYLSMDAPMARGLMKRQVDDEVEVMTPDGMRRVVIIEVSYQS
jgi:transcription elongation factor GreB